MTLPVRTNAMLLGLRDVIMRNTDIKRLPDNVYFRMANAKWPTA